MRNIGVFTRAPIPATELVGFVESYSAVIGQPYEKKPEEILVGSWPDRLYVFEDTTVTEVYLTQEETRSLETTLGSSPQGYVDIHLTSTDTAFALADAMAREIARRWEGVIDYNGAGGHLGTPPERLDET